MRRAASWAVIAIAAALVPAGCGGSGSSTSATGASTVSPRPAYKCLTGAGLPVKVAPPPDPSTIAVLVINHGTLHQVSISFMKTDAGAKKFAKSAGAFLAAAGGKARARLVGGTVVLGVGPKATADELHQITGCVTS